MTLWHGYEPAAILERWDRQLWREEVARSLIDIARDDDATTEQRLDALQMLDAALTNDLLKEPTGFSFVDFSCQVMLYIARGQARASWLARWRRRKFAIRLTGARWMLTSAARFLSESREVRETKRPIGVLPS